MNDFNVFMDELPLWSAPFGLALLVVSNNGTNNVADVHKTFMECRRIMKRGGQLVIAVNTEQTMTEFYQLFEAVLLEQGLAETMAKHKTISAENGCQERSWSLCCMPADLRSGR